jgi:hypothetical protein
MIQRHYNAFKTAFQRLYKQGYNYTLFLLKAEKHIDFTVKIQACSKDKKNGFIFSVNHSEQAEPPLIDRLDYNTYYFLIIIIISVKPLKRV